MYVTDPADAARVAEVHGEVFGKIRPAATLVVVAALIEPGLLVEIEADAVRERRAVRRRGVDVGRLTSRRSVSPAQARPSARAAAAMTAATTRPTSRLRRIAIERDADADREPLDADVGRRMPLGVDGDEGVDRGQGGQHRRADEAEVLLDARRQAVHPRAPGAGPPATGTWPGP